MQDKLAQPPGPKAPPDKPSVYGGRWGPGAAPTPHNRPGTVANDPASAPADRKPSGTGTQPPQPRSGSEPR